MFIAHTIARIFRFIQQMSDMVMELQTTWDSKGLAAKIATIIQADVMIVFLSAVKNALNIAQKLTEEFEDYILGRRRLNDEHITDIQRQNPEPQAMG